MSQITNAQLIELFFGFQASMDKIQAMMDDIQEKSTNVALTLRERIVIVVENLLRENHKFSDIEYLENYNELKDVVLDSPEFAQRVIVRINPTATVEFPDGSEDYALDISYFLEDGQPGYLMTVPLKYLTNPRFTDRKIIVVSGGAIQ